ncbi:YcjF family protein [Haploplasma axanthum]|uniref:Domain of uncharacterized function (DUF697) n=1 Tax=Haploplasma axanthum TaxID=29552 RepID=A0A449BE96_HAPAX|nr:YcjF family protein [Haploplasma axanthum]VEU80748.1 Domain of uncharacterised function (DUF697) [Haploplasma axanthum]
MNKTKSKSRFLWYAIALGVIVLFLLMLLSSVLGVGERLRKINEWVEYGFYVLVVILVYLLILRPVHIILFSPSFSVETTLDKDSRKNRAVYKKVAKRLIEQDILPEELKDDIKNNMKNTKELKEALNKAFNKHVKKEINAVIRKNAKTVMVSTAISQNGRLDLYTVVVVNIKMIRELVEMCGFRPNMKNLSKLTINVFTTALIAEGLENMDLNDLLPNSTMNILGEIPLIKPLISSILQGVSNALLTLRIGIVTRKYLFSDAKEITKEEIRRGALIEAAAMLPGVVGEAIAMFPKKLFGLFKKKPKKETEMGEND